MTCSSSIILLLTSLTKCLVVISNEFCLEKKIGIIVHSSSGAWHTLFEKWEQSLCEQNLNKCII